MELLWFQDRGLSKIFGDLSALHSKDSDEGESFDGIFGLLGIPASLTCWDGI